MFVPKLFPRYEVNPYTCHKELGEVVCIASELPTLRGRPQGAVLLITRSVGGNWGGKSGRQSIFQERTPSLIPPVSSARPDSEVIVAEQLRALARIRKGGRPVWPAGPVRS